MRFMCTGRWIVILDVDGVLCTRIRTNKQVKPTRKYDYGKKKIKAWFRPHVREFVSELINNDFAVGTWTSSTKRNAEPLLESLLGENLFGQLVIKAYREQCTPDTEAEKKWGSIKVVKNLLQEYPSFTEDKTIVLDDSPSKMRRNIQDLCIHVPTYCPSNVNIDYDNDTTLLSLLPQILQIRDESCITVDKLTDSLQSLQVKGE